MKNHSTKDTAPFHIWKYEVELAAIAKGSNVEFVREHLTRVGMWFDAGEPVWMAAESLALMSAGSKLAADKKRLQGFINARRTKVA